MIPTPVLDWYAGDRKDGRSDMAGSAPRCMLGHDSGFSRQEHSMSGDGESQSAESGQVPVPTPDRVPAVRREGAVAVGATAIGALALGAFAVGALAVGALAIGKLAIGQLGLGRARLRSGQVDELRIARLTIQELRVERMPGKQ